MEIVQLPTLNDNYTYLVHDSTSGNTACIDPAIEYNVLSVLAKRGWSLTHIFNTHHHHDHIGGNLGLKVKTGCTIVGADYDAARIPGIDIKLKDGEIFTFGNTKMKALYVPGHTNGHIAYWFEDEKALFAGDALFAMGCGRLFEGSAEDMWSSLSKFNHMPDETNVYCAHEYTLSNGKFAKSLEDNNSDLNNRIAKCEALRNKGKPTVPFTLGEDRKTNPFLRADDPALQAAIGMDGQNPVDVFAEIRSRKDNF